MKDLINTEIVTPLGVIYQGEVKSVTSPESEEEFGALKGHTTLVVSLKPGAIDIEKQDLKYELVAIDSGYAKVDEDKVCVLAKGTVWVCGSSESEIEKNLSNAKDLIKTMSSDNVALAAAFSKFDNAKTNV